MRRPGMRRVWPEYSWAAVLETVLKEGVAGRNRREPESRVERIAAIRKHAERGLADRRIQRETRAAGAACAAAGDDMLERELVCACRSGDAGQQDEGTPAHFP